MILILPYDPEDVKSHLTVPYLMQIDDNGDASSMRHLKMLPMTGDQTIISLVRVNLCIMYKLI